MAISLLFLCPRGATGYVCAALLAHYFVILCSNAEPALFLAHHTCTNTDLHVTRFMHVYAAARLHCTISGVISCICIREPSHLFLSDPYILCSIKQYYSRKRVFRECVQDNQVSHTFKSCDGFFLNQNFPHLLFFQKGFQRKYNNILHRIMKKVA